MSFDKIETAARVRDIIKRQTTASIQAEVPRKLIGRMMNVDLPRHRGTVWFPGDTQPVEVIIFPSAVPAEWQHKNSDAEGEGSSIEGAGAMVVVERLNGLLWVTHILSGTQASLDFQSLNLSLLMQKAADSAAGDLSSNASVDIVGDPYQTFINCLVKNDSLLDGEALEFGPFTTYNADYPRFGSMKFTVQVGGSVKLYELTANPKVEFSSPYQYDRRDAWYRLIPVHSINDDDGGSYIETDDDNNYDFDLDLAFKKTRYGNAADFSVWKELWIRIIKRGTWPGGLEAKVAIESTNLFKGRSLGGRELFMQERVVNPRSARGYLGAHKAQHIFSNELGFIEDVFDRVATNGWLDTTGQSPGIFNIPTTNASTFSADGLKGTVAISTNNSASDIEVGGISVDNIDVFATFSIRAVPTGANVRAGVLTRWAASGSGNNCVLAIEFKTDSTIQAIALKTISGTTTTIATVATGVPYTANQKIKVHFRMFSDPIVGGQEERAQIRVWQEGEREPAAWHLSATDAAIPNSGNLGVRVLALTGNTNTKPLSVDLHDIQYITLEWFGENAGHQWHTGPFRSAMLRLANDLQKTWTHDGMFKWDGTYLKLTGKIYLHGVGSHRDGLVSGRAFAFFPSAFYYLVKVPSILAAGNSIDWDDGVPLAPEESLWLGVLPGTENKDLTGSFFVVSPDEVLEYQLPEWAILIAARAPSGVAPEIRLGNGQMLDKWRAISFSAGWTNQVGDEARGAYRMLGNNCIHFVGAFAAGTKTDNTTWATLPVGFRPERTVWAPMTVDNQVTGQSPKAGFTVSGNVICYGMGTSSYVAVNAIVPLDGVS